MIARRSDGDAEAGRGSGETADRHGAELRSSLDRLEERVKLLVARHEELAEHYRALVQVQQRLEGAVDPIELDERMRGLVAENRRLSRHAAFLEERIRELLSRIRYVVEA